MKTKTITKTGEQMVKLTFQTKDKKYSFESNTKSTFKDCHNKFLNKIQSVLPLKVIIEKYPYKIAISYNEFLNQINN